MKEYLKGTPEYEAAVKDAEEEARGKLIFVKKGKGFCHLLWEEKSGF